MRTVLATADSFPRPNRRADAAPGQPAAATSCRPSADRNAGQIVRKPSARRQEQSIRSFSHPNKLPLEADDSLSTRQSGEPRETPDGAGGICHSPPYLWLLVGQQRGAVTLHSAQQCLEADVDL